MCECFPIVRIHPSEESRLSHAAEFIHTSVLELYVCYTHRVLYYRGNIYYTIPIASKLRAQHLRMELSHKHVPKDLCVELTEGRTWVFDKYPLKWLIKSVKSTHPDHIISDHYDHPTLCCRSPFNRVDTSYNSFFKKKKKAFSFSFWCSGHSSNSDTHRLL